MRELPLNEFVVPFDGSFRVAEAATAVDGDSKSKKELESSLRKNVKAISKLQRKLYADNRFSILMVFQAMDAAGKDGTIRAVMSGVNPAGCVVSSFKSPSSEELDHDFMWRTSRRLPERGIIGIFNRSYYEEVLAVRVRPEFLAGQRLPPHGDTDIWQGRYASIREHEEHLSRNGTIILKFWLNVSLQEQKRRFLERLTNPEKYWKFSSNDLSERGRWAEYMDAYEVALKETSRPYAPWFAIPADDKPRMRLHVAKTLRHALEALPLRYPEKKTEEIQRFEEYRQSLEDE